MNDNTPCPVTPTDLAPARGFYLAVIVGLLVWAVTATGLVVWQITSKQPEPEPKPILPVVE